MADQQANPLEGAPAEGIVSPETIRIVLADDHAVVRSGLRLLLDNEPDFEVVAEASDVAGASRYVRGHHPAVLVLDLNMPGGSSLEAIPAIREESPDTQIVVLTMQQEPAFARQALGSGALGYVLKEAADAEIAEQLYLSVRTVETHRSHIQQKLRLSTRAELVGYALERGLIDTSGERG